MTIIDVILDADAGEAIRAVGNGKLRIKAGSKEPLTIRGGIILIMVIMFSISRILFTNLLNYCPMPATILNGPAILSKRICILMHSTQRTHQCK
jgi:hypothetical protein